MEEIVDGMSKIEINDIDKVIKVQRLFRKKLLIKNSCKKNDKGSNIITILDLKKSFSEMRYIKQSTSNKKKDETSLSYLINRNLSQSECIRLGIAIEKLFQFVIEKFTTLCNIKQKNIKGVKEKDHLFSNEDMKKIYYAELKANIYLDTEKSKSTYTKCLDIVKELEIQYPEYEINWCLVGYRYIHNSHIPNNVKRKYSVISDNLYGINQYLTLLNIKLQFNEENYKDLLNDFADTMFSSS